jgi:para-aminobenzoate synthetase/4-amino-4-deoxychorismate lyase
LSISSVFKPVEVATMTDVFDRRRPDPQLGVLETLLVLDGRPVDLDAHLARLAASLGELFPDRPAPQPAEEVKRRAAGVELGRLRIAISPSAGGFDVDAVVHPGPVGRFAPLSTTNRPTDPVGLRTLVVDGGLGPHKWADRSLVDEAQARLPAAALPLIVDRDGAVLEASRANVFAVRRGALFTPPLDGRILPGITRARAIEVASALGLDIHEAELTREDLRDADEVFLSGSVRGIEPAAALDGVPLGHSRAVSDRLGAELRRSWAGERTAAAFG